MQLVIYENAGFTGRTANNPEEAAAILKGITTHYAARAHGTTAEKATFYTLYTRWPDQPVACMEVAHGITDMRSTLLLWALDELDDGSDDWTIEDFLGRVEDHYTITSGDPEDWAEELIQNDGGAPNWALSFYPTIVEAVAKQARYERLIHHVVKDTGPYVIEVNQ